MYLKQRINTEKNRALFQMSFLFSLFLPADFFFLTRLFVFPGVCLKPAPLGLLVTGIPVGRPLKGCSDFELEE